MKNYKLYRLKKKLIIPPNTMLKAAFDDESNTYVEFDVNFTMEEFVKYFKEAE